MRAIYAGVGTKDKDLNAYLQVDGRKVLHLEYQLNAPANQDTVDVDWPSNL
jgi:hypothetical protein